MEEGNREVFIKGNRDYPDEIYKINYKRFLSTWSFQRFKKPYKNIRVDLESNKMIPFPGKGTAGYNCGEDGTWGGTFATDNVDKAIEDLIKRVNYRRQNYPL